ncbi:MAG: energy transducer TonB, partial [Bradymonadaceae bacterium]
AVGLDRTDWNCPWPEQADHLSVDEQVVVLQAVVGPDGQPRSVSLVSDPGFGFGQAALTCARDHRFRPSLDENGEPQTASSPPIRVRFTR